MQSPFPNAHLITLHSLSLPFRPPYKDSWTRCRLSGMEHPVDRSRIDDVRFHFQRFQMVILRESVSIGCSKRPSESRAEIMPTSKSPDRTRPYRGGKPTPD